jgi:hypothetical protein
MFAITSDQLTDIVTLTENISLDLDWPEPVSDLERAAWEHCAAITAIVAAVVDSGEIGQRPNGATK